MSRLTTALFSSLVLLLAAVSVQAAEPEAAEPEAAEPEAAEPEAAQLQAEVLRYYLGVGVEATEAEAASGLTAASDLLLAGISTEQLSAAVDAAIDRHEAGGRVLFQVAVPRFLRASAAEEVAPAAATEALTEADDSALEGQGRSALSTTPRTAPRDWKKRFSLEVEQHQRDWGIVTAIMLGAIGGVGGTALLVGAAADGYDNPVGLTVGLFHLGSLGLMAHYLNVVNSTLAGIKGVVASSPDAEATVRRMHRARVGTGVAAVVLAGVGTAALPLGITLSDAGFDSDALVPVALFSGFASLTLLSISLAHLALEVEFEKLAAGGHARSPRKAPAVRVVVTPTGIVGWF
jgi:hypothetical protein